MIFISEIQVLFAKAITYESKIKQGKFLWTNTAFCIFILVEEVTELETKKIILYFLVTENISKDTN